jgi:hypothetical protein
MVPAESVDRAGTLLEAVGYHPVAKEYYGRQHFHIPYCRRSSSLTTTVELHWDVVKPGSLIRFEIDRWWREAYSTSLRGTSVLLPPLVEEIHYLCHHAFLDGAVTLRNLEDIARWVDRYDGELDWDEAAARARASGTAHFVREALVLCGELWGTPASGLHLFPTTAPNRRWLARNLVHPATVLRAGAGTWWPFRHICYWSLLEPSAADLRALVSRVDRGTRFMGLEDPSHSSQARGVRLFSLALALAFCTLPVRLFPFNFREGRGHSA